MVWLGPITSVNVVFCTSAILPEMDCIAVVCSFIVVVLGSVTGIAQTTATRIRLAMLHKTTFSSFFIFVPSWGDFDWCFGKCRRGATFLAESPNPLSPLFY